MTFFRNFLSMKGLKREETGDIQSSNEIKIKEYLWNGFEHQNIKWKRQNKYFTPMILNFGKQMNFSPLPALKLPLGKHLKPSYEESSVLRLAKKIVHQKILTKTSAMICAAQLGRPVWQATTGEIISTLHTLGPSKKPLSASLLFTFLKAVQARERRGWS